LRVFFERIGVLRLRGLLRVMVGEINLGEGEELLVGKRLWGVVWGEWERGIDEDKGEKGMVDFDF
ncbi:hypothetical protein, partial [Neisseria sicca]|uniref:hypothetical protein n=1 Tax=Neisseria sicca TaxID=490 RepID=UPI001C9910FA